MALSVASYTNIASWFSTTATRSVTGLAWSAGDIIVIVGGTENASTTIGNPTNANLTIGAPKASSTSGGGAECAIYVWASTAAAGAQTGQSISATASGGLMWGMSVWVITGAPTGFANATANLTETAISRTVSAGSIVCYGLTDFNATNPPAKTPATGSGSANERLDQGNTTNYAQYLCDWVGTAAGTFNFGPNNYTSLKVAQAIVEITGPSGITGTVAVTLAPFVSAASGTSTPPAITGTVAVTLGAFTSTASGTSTPPLITGTTAVTLGSFVSSAAGTVTGPGVTGTVAVTLQPFTSSAAGTYTPPAITGTAAVTLGSFVAAASGTVAGAGAIVGTIAVTLNPFTANATGTVGTPAIVGTVAVTLGPFVCVAFDIAPALTTLRLFRVRGEDRTLIVAAEDRTLSVPPVPVVVVPVEGRTLIVRPSVRIETVEAP